MAVQGTSLEELPAELMRLIDALDVESCGALLTGDAQGIDEISRGWMRGRESIEAYLEQIKDTVAGLHSSVSDVHAVQWGDTGVVTFVLDQSYDYVGRHVEITAPTSLVCRREDTGWKVAVFHSAPLPEAGA